MIALMLGLAGLLFFFRAGLVHRCWSLPLKYGKERFLTLPVPEDFYQGAGGMLLRRYRASLFVPLAVDAPLVVWMLLTDRYALLSLEQLLAYIVGLVAYNVMLVHFAIRAANLAGEQGAQAVKTVQLSMEPRRLRDHTHLWVELVFVVSLALEGALLWRAWQFAHAAGATHDATNVFRGGVVGAIWSSYWQLGLLLLKWVFVRWRMPLPVNRTEDFKRWRSAWLDSNLNTLDAVRLLTAVTVTWVTGWLVYQRSWSTSAVITLAAGSLLIVVVYFAYLLGVRRRLKAAEKELKPVEMVKEFPRRPVAEGRYLAGGLLYFNRDNPSLLVRSPQGVAINLFHPGAYAWTAYFAGLAVLITWMAR